MKVELEIDTCYECPHSTNNARLHDDPFTSGPSYLIWYCTHTDFGGECGILDCDVYNEIDSYCPIIVKGD